MKFNTPKEVLDYENERLIKSASFKSVSLLQELVRGYNRKIEKKYLTKQIPYILKENIPVSAYYGEHGRPGFCCRNLDELLEIKDFRDRYEGHSLLYESSNGSFRYDKSGDLTGYLYMLGSVKHLVGTFVGDFPIGRCVLIEKKGKRIKKIVYKF